MEKQKIIKTLVYTVPSILVTGLLVWFSFFPKNNKTKEEPAPETPIQEEIQEPVSPEQSQPPEEIQETLLETPTIPAQTTMVPPSPAEEPDYLAEAASLSQDALWKSFLSPAGLKNLMLMLDEIGLGLVPAKSMAEYRSKTAFTATKQNGEWRISPECTARYTPIVDLFCSIDATRAGKLYNLLSPKLAQALSELGYQGRTPDEVTAKAISVLRSTPQPKQDPALVRLDEHLYHWKDQELEALMPVQKFALRLGVQNLDRIRKQAEAIATAAGFEAP